MGRGSWRPPPRVLGYRWVLNSGPAPNPPGRGGRRNPENREKREKTTVFEKFCMEKLRISPKFFHPRIALGRPRFLYAACQQRFSKGEELGAVQIFFFAIGPSVKPFLHKKHQTHTYVGHMGERGSGPPIRVSRSLRLAPPFEKVISDQSRFLHFFDGFYFF